MENILAAIIIVLFILMLLGLWQLIGFHNMGELQYCYKKFHHCDQDNRSYSGTLARKLASNDRKDETEEKKENMSGGSPFYGTAYAQYYN